MQPSSDDNAALRGYAVVLHAHNPPGSLPAAVRELIAAGFAGVVVVDDCSAPSSEALFREAGQIERAEICGHGIALGRGASFRTGIHQALYRFANIAGIVTATTDDSAANIVRIAQAAARRPDAMIVGALPGSTSTASRLLLQALAGATVTDPSSALRAIPAAYAKELLERDAPGKEFELDALLAARTESVAIVEEPVERGPAAGAVAMNLLASPRAWMALLRFASVSLATVIIDNLVFYLAMRRGATILAAQVAARTFAGVFNYLAVRRAVFRGDSHHAIAAPRYVSLVAAGGAVSYVLIRLILAATHAPVTAIKIGVETLLFFANFAIQRDWVFLRKEPDASQPATRQTPGWLQATLWLLLLLPAAAEYYGFRYTHLLRQSTWQPDGAMHFRNYTLAFAALTFAGLFARRWFIPVLTLGLIGCTVFAVGAAPPAALLLFVFSTTVLGRFALGEGIEGPLAFLAGTAFWIAAMSLVATLPIHYPAVYLAALVIPLLVGHRHTLQLAQEWSRVVRATCPKRLAPLPEYAAFAGLAFVLIANWLIVLKPEVSADGLAMHLNIPAGMAIHHAYTVDFHQFIWALMPIGGDFCYAVLYSLGGEYAARLLNFAMLIAIAALVCSGARRFSSRPVALFFALLCVSTPMVYLVTGSLFVENFVAAMVLGGLIALWRFHETHARSYLLLAAILLGTSIALKLGAVAAGLIGLGYLLWEVRQSRRAVNPVARGAAVAALVLLLILGAIPYAKAWHLTGNPLFPFETAAFKSPLVNGRDIQDTRYNHGIHWNTPYQLTFHTDLFHEGQPGTMGFQYLLFLPLTLAGFFALRSFQSRTAIIIGGVSALIIAGTQSNGRYFYFALPPLTLGAAAALSWVRQRQPSVYRAAIAAAGVALALNVWLLPCADWYHRDFYTAPLFSASGRAAYQHASEGAIREVTAWMNQNNTTRPVVFTDNSAIAGLIAPVYTNHWHDYAFTMQVQAQLRPADVYRLFRRYNIAEMVVDRSHTDRQVAVTQIIAACGIPEFAADPYIAMKLRPDCEGALRQLPTGAVICSPGEPLPPGNYDESDPRIVFAGTWTASKAYANAFSRTISFSNAPGSTVCFTMEGTGFDYTHAVAFNRGRAEVLVDGAPIMQVDLYNPDVQWQARTPVRGLQPGRHVVSIRVLPEKAAAATDFFIDLDGITVY